MKYRAFIRLRKFPPTMPLFLFGGSLTTTVRSDLKYVMMKRLPSSSGTPVLLVATHSLLSVHAWILWMCQRKPVFFRIH